MRYKKFEEIPGVFERGLNCINCANRDKVIMAAKLAAELSREYNMTTAYFSTRGTAKEFEYLYFEGFHGRTGKIYAENLEDGDCKKLCDRIAVMIEEGQIQSFIVDCLEGLDIKDFKDGGIRAKRSEIKFMLHAYAKGRPALLLCPPARSRKSEDGIELFGCSILEEMWIHSLKKEESTDNQ